MNTLLFLFVVTLAVGVPVAMCNFVNTALPPTLFDKFSSSSPAFLESAPSPQVQFTSEGLRLSICKRYDNPQLVSHNYLLYGKVEAEMRALDGPGVISSLYLQSDDLDEIDIAEISGSIPLAYQTNYFVKGNTTNFDRGQYHSIPSSPSDSYHKYGVEWTPLEVIWYFDNNVIRRLSRENVHGFPGSPMRVYLSTWAGGDPGNLPGTVQWAGGVTTYANLPYTMQVRSIFIENYLLGGTYVYVNGENTPLFQASEVSLGPTGSEADQEPRGNEILQKSESNCFQPSRALERIPGFVRYLPVVMMMALVMETV